jgi:Tfp pilus assembly protein PilO
MNENLTPDEHNENSEESKKLAEMTVNDYGETKDSTVVIEEEDRTVMLTKDETLIIEKTPKVWDIVPKNRPRKVYGGMWGQAEIATVGLSLLAILTVLVFYIFFVMPAKKELEANKAQRDQVEAELASAKSKYGSITNTETQVAKLLTSVNDFETRFLPAEISGKSALYERLNGLIGAYGLINSNGPVYAPLEIADPQRSQQTDNERGRDKLRSLFPGVFVTVTVEGSYQNLRRFINDIETSGQFILISAVELVPAERQVRNANPEQAQQINENGQIQPENNQTLGDVYRGKMQGEWVSLKLDMAAYFRRPDYTPFISEVSVK